MVSLMVLSNVGFNDRPIVPAFTETGVLGIIVATGLLTRAFCRSMRLTPAAAEMTIVCGSRACSCSATVTVTGAGGVKITTSGCSSTKLCGSKTSLNLYSWASFSTRGFLGFKAIKSYLVRLFNPCIMAPPMLPTPTIATFIINASFRLVLF